MCIFFGSFRYSWSGIFREDFSVIFSQFNPILFDKSNIAKINRLSTVNVVCVGSVSQIVTMLSNHNLSEDYKENAAEFIRKCASELNGERIKSYIQQASNHLI